MMTLANRLMMNMPVIGGDSKYPTDGLIGHWPFNGDVKAEFGNIDGVAKNLNFVDVGNKKVASFNKSSVIMNLGERTNQELTIAFFIENKIAQTSCVIEMLTQSNAIAYSIQTAYSYDYYMAYKSGNTTNLMPNKKRNNEWTCLCFTFSNNAVKYFENGIKYHSRPGGSDINFNKMVVGHRNNMDTFSGSMSNLFVYDRILTDEEIKKINDIGV